LEHGVERLCQLIDDVLVSAAVDGGGCDNEPIDVDLGPLMETALAPASAKARVLGIPFRAQYAPGLWLHVDPGTAVAALRTVADNAVDFAERGDVAIDVEDRGGELAVHVRATTNDGLPTGVKLVVARRALEASGWAITAECSLNVCCHVCLTLPASRP
jgi:signal transduction histidine kinase